MKIFRKPSTSGHSTLEYALLMPIIFICVFVCIIVFLILYQKAIIQNIAEEAAQSLSRQWGYNPLPMEEINSGVYKRETYDSREIYWNLKLLFSEKKKKDAREHIEKSIRNVGLLKPYNSQVSGDNAIPATTVNVDIKPGLPAVLNIEIKAAYMMPAKNLMKLIGIGDCLILKANARSLIFDPKDMINTTDYVYQLISSTDLYRKFIKKIEPLKKNLDRILKE
ncbi:MAG: pilus assembly protein [Clostridiaceae bacterium]|nr:pilus assembly protein [Clostridiaceae bacterium]